MRKRRESPELTIEVATDPTFQRVVATTRATILADSDWTCRVLVGGLEPRTVYWYRFLDDAGNGSRIKTGRKVPEGFVYASDTNSEWLSVEALRAWIAANRDRLVL